MMRRGVLLAGGRNSRLYPATAAVPKSLLAVYDKPLIYYPLSLLMLADVREILVITTPDGLALHQQCLGNGEAFGISLSYATQNEPRGIADALIIARDFLRNAPCALVLSDNIFYGGALAEHLQTAGERLQGATVFCTAVADATQFGVLELDADNRPAALCEKPQNPKSNLAITGCYFYDEQASDLAAGLQPSARDELEITDLNQCYLDAGRLHAEILDADTNWFDTGTPDSMASAAAFVRTTQAQQQTVIASPPAIAWEKKWIDDAALAAHIQHAPNTAYTQHLRSLLG